MKKLTSSKQVQDMTIDEMARNACYIDEYNVRYRDYIQNVDARVYIRNILWNIAEFELRDAAKVEKADQIFDKQVFDLLQYDPLSACKNDAVLGLIALFYRNMRAQAELHERLKEFEDTGLTPDRMLEIDRAYYELSREVRGLREKVAELEAKNRILAAGMEEDHGKA